MNELILLNNIKYDSKLLLLRELGFNSDGIYVLDSQGKKILDRYIEEPVKIENMLILPGSTIIIDNNPLSIALYMEEHSGVF